MSEESVCALHLCQVCASHLQVQPGLSSWWRLLTQHEVKRAPLETIVTSFRTRWHSLLSVGISLYIFNDPVFVDLKNMFFIHT